LALEHTVAVFNYATVTVKEFGARACESCETDLLFKLCNFPCPFQSFHAKYLHFFTKLPSFRRGTRLALDTLRERPMRDGNRKFNSGSLMTAQALADRSRVPVENVRYYTRRGLLKPVRHRKNNYRLYQESDIARLRFIRQAKNLGYTLKEIAGIFEQGKRGDSPCPMVREIIERRIADNRKRLDEMLGLQERMETALACWAEMPDKAPDGHSVCHLIESTPPAG
jgi:MerR family transcriptional regulator, Zn(II)-responsive regulator of zntA